MGPAAEILRGFDDSAENALNDLCGQLRHRFGTVDECQQAVKDFESRTQSDSESLAEFEQVVSTLHREAWPDQTEEQRDLVLKRRFSRKELLLLTSDSICIFTIKTLTFVRLRRRLESSQLRWLKPNQRKPYAS